MVFEQIFLRVLVTIMRVWNGYFNFNRNTMDFICLIRSFNGCFDIFILFEPLISKSVIILAWLQDYL